MTPRRALAALAVLALVSVSCVTLPSTCSSACAELAFHMLCSSMDSFCRDEGGLDADDGAIVEPDPEDTARRLAEAPPPEWQPEPGRAACEVRRAEGLVHVSCADGARARFKDVPDTALVVEESTTPHDPCVGRARKQGVDADGDGALSSLEVRGRVVVCESESELFSPSLVGDVAIASPDDVAFIAGRRAVTGGVFLTGDALLELELPQLRSIGGTLRAANADELERISCERLAHVGADVSFSGLPALVDIDLPTLAHVGGSLAVTDNPALPQRALERVVVRLSRKGFSGPVTSGGNAP